MKKSFSVFIIIMLCLSVASTFIKIPKVKADTTQTIAIYATDDYYIWKTGSSYSTVHNSTTGTVADFSPVYEIFQVGQSAIPGYAYQVSRSYLYFDTSVIPDTANISSAILSVQCDWDNSNSSEFNVTITNGQPTYPHNPIQAGDFLYSDYSGDGGSRSTTEWAGQFQWWNITLNEDGRSWLSKTGETKLCLKSSRDISSSEPEGYEIVAFCAIEGNVANTPILYVTYTVYTNDYYNYYFYGPFDEETGWAMDENVTVGVWSREGLGFEYFNLSSSYIYNCSTLVLFFQFTFEDGSRRQYWVDPSESNTSEIYVFWGNTTTYAINFLDTTSILDTYPYVTAKRYINGSLYTVEKRRVDIYNTVLMNLINGRTYTLYLGNAETTYVFGELTMTSTTGVQLTLRGVDFPKETLLTQKYVRCYAYRNGTSIIVWYNDTSEATQSVSVSIQYSDFAEAYSNVLYTNSFSLEWTSADEDLGYVVVVTATHETYGTLTYKTILPANTAVSVAPFNLDWLGTWTFNSEYLLPAFIILMVAGCFSALNAEVGAVLMCITAIVLTAMGWIPIPAGLLVTGITLAIIMALVVHKRRGG